MINYTLIRDRENGIEVETEYLASFTGKSGIRTGNWRKLGSLHCPGCGKKNVFMDDSGDYYVGNKHICLNCECVFYLPDGLQNLYEDEKEIVNKIKNKTEFV